MAPRGERWPAARPVWFEATDDGDLQMFSVPDAPKLDRLQEHPRAPVVATPSGEPEHWVAVEGSGTLHDQGGAELAGRLAERYRDDMSDPNHQRFLG